MSTITIVATKENLAGISAVALFASARDKIVPILDTVKFTHTHAVATDRYVVGRFEHTPDAETLAEGIVAPREIAEWIGKIKPTHHATATGPATAIITITDDRAEYSEYGRVLESRPFSQNTANFPPVERLLFEKSDETIETGPFALTPKNLIKIVKAGALISASLGKTETPIRFQHSTQTGRSTAPIRGEIGRLVTLIQPNIIK